MGRIHPSYLISSQQSLRGQCCIPFVLVDPYIYLAFTPVLSNCIISSYVDDFIRISLREIQIRRHCSFPDASVLFHCLPTQSYLTYLPT